MWEENVKDNTRKNNSTTWGNKPEGSGKRNETKEISTKGKTIQIKQDIPKQRKKILSTIGMSMTQKHTRQPEKRQRILDENMATEKALTKRLNG